MAHLIDKDALLAEIEELKTAIDIKLRSSNDSAYWKAQSLICERLEFKVNSLEVKEVDLDSDIRIYLTNHFNVYKDGVLQSKKSELPLRTYDIIKTAKHFFELGLKAQKGE